VNIQTDSPGKVDHNNLPIHVALYDQNLSVFPRCSETKTLAAVDNIILKYTRKKCHEEYDAVMSIEVY
jgi:hypothetical protein